MGGKKFRGKNLMNRKSIILAGGSSIRLHPVTKVVSKQMLPIYDKPMVYYALSTLMSDRHSRQSHHFHPVRRHALRATAGRRKRLVAQPTIRVATQSRWSGSGLYHRQRLCGRRHSGLVFGGNIFYGKDLHALPEKFMIRNRGSTVFSYHLEDSVRYGVVALDAQGHDTSLEEKPASPKSHYAVTGLYFDDNQVVDTAAELKPSARGELELTDLNRIYLARVQLNGEIMGKAYAWLNCGTHESLIEASNFIQTIEHRQGLKVSCPQEIAYRKVFINAQQLEKMAQPIGKNGYGQYLKRLLEEGVQP